MRISDQDANRLRVLKAIRRAEPVARTELVELTGLPAWAISDLVGELVDVGVLVEERAPAVGRGRPRIQLRINPEGAFVVGATLTGDLNIEIANLRGDSLFGRSFAMPLGLELEALGELVAARTEETILASPFPKSAIHSVGVGVAGIVESRSGALLWLPGYGPGPYPFAGLIGERLGLPTNLDGIGNMLTRAEHWFGEDRQVDDFTMVYASFGIVAGQYVDGFLRTGDHGINPTISHVKVTPGEGPACHCGGRGCLERYVSISGIVERVSERRGLARPPPIEPVMAAFRQMAAEAGAGEPVARGAFEFAGQALGVAMANYVNLWDPSRILILAQEPAWAEVVEPPFRAAFAENTHQALRGRVPVQFKTGEVTFTRGAAAFALERLYLRSGEDRRKRRGAADGER